MKAVNKSHICAGAVAGLMLWILGILIGSIILFVGVRIFGAEYSGSLVNIKSFFQDLITGIIFGAFYDFLPGKKSATKGIALELLISATLFLYVFGSFGLVWARVEIPFVIISIVAWSILIGAFLGWSFDFARKKV